MKKNKLELFSNSEPSAILASTDHKLTQNSTKSLKITQKQVLIQKLEKLQLENALLTVNNLRLGLQHEQAQLYEILFEKKRKLMKMNQEFFFTCQLNHIKNSQKPEKNIKFNAKDTKSVFPAKKIDFKDQKRSKYSTNLASSISCFPQHLNKIKQEAEEICLSNKINTYLSYLKLSSTQKRFQQHQSYQNHRKDKQFDDNLKNKNKSMFDTIENIWNEQEGKK